jgi:hypothetical protein
MGDQQVCHLELPFEIHDEIQDLSLNGAVECGNWLVENYELWPEPERTREADALALSTREVARETSGIVRIEADHLHELPDLLFEIAAFRNSVNGHRLADDLTDPTFRI